VATRIIAICGGPKTGKTTLAQALGTDLRRRGRRVTHLDESAGGGRNVAEMIRAAAADADLVVAEGFLTVRLPRIEVFRHTAGGSPIFSPDRPDADDWVAIVTDDPALRAACRILRFTDTMWMQQLAALAWDRARVLGG
jgi:molybdopterin-guanine dinucleotide biosynthesis protein